MGWNHQLDIVLPSVICLCDGKISMWDCSTIFLETAYFHYTKKNQSKTESKS